MSGKKLSTHAQAARLIRGELKAMGLGKSKVRSERYAGGTSIYVELEGKKDLWFRQEVRRKLGKYCYGSYDGLTDAYVVDNAIEDLPQVKHLFVR